MSAHACAVFIPRDSLIKMLRGQARLCLPADAEIVAFTPCTDRHGEGLGLRVHSRSFAEVPHGAPLPRITATIKNRDEEPA